MIQEHVIEKILAAGAAAPSGENAQPWRFVVGNDRISLVNIPERDRSLYNFKERASHIAHGAVIENMVIAASRHGCSAAVTLFPDRNDPDLVAVLALAKAPAKGEPLYDFIPKRCTNRKLYDAKPVPADTLAALSDAAQRMSGVRARFVTDAEGMRKIGEASSVNDRLLLENRNIHDFFFSHVHWTMQEEEEKRSGFYIEVLELPPPVKALFKVFRHWPVMNVLNKLGIAKMGAKQNIAVYASAGAIGALVIADRLPSRFVEAGRAFERLWLTAASKDIALQPLTGVLFFHQRIEEGDGEKFSAAHRDAVEAAYRSLASAFDAASDTIAMMFRIGYAEPPSAHSLKMPPSVIRK